MAKLRTWVVVADGAHAAVYASAGPGKGLDEPAVREFIGDSHPTREINADRPGRSFDSVGDARHAMEPHTDAHRHAQQVLAHDIAGFLDAAAQRGDYDRLVIAAQPRTLGDLRAEMSTKVQAKLAGDLAKDLMHVAPRDLPPYFADIVKL
jgi:protein required for attachment to host cells